MPGYTVGRGKDKRAYTVSGVSCDECPAGYIEPRWAHFVRMVGRGWWVHGFTGAPMFPPDQSRWPAVVVDALEVIAVERNRIEAAESAAVMRGDHESA